MKKLLIFFIVVITIASSIIGCGTKKEENSAVVNENKEENQKVANQDNSLEEVKQKGKLVLGLDASFPPMGFKNDNQEIIGFDIDLANEVCKRMGIELKTIPISWDAKEQELKTKNIDCIWNGMSYNNDRDATMTLSSPYMKNRQLAVVLADSSIKSLIDLKGKTVVIQSGSTASDAMDANEEFTNSLKQLIKVDDNVQALMDLKVSGSDAVVMDEVVARYYTEKEPDTFRILDDTLSEEEYVIGFRKGDEALKNEVEKQLKEMAADGTLKKISTTWFGEDITLIK